MSNKNSIRSILCNDSLSVQYQRSMQKRNSKRDEKRNNRIDYPSFTSKLNTQKTILDYKSLMKNLHKEEKNTSFLQAQPSNNLRVSAGKGKHASSCNDGQHDCDSSEDYSSEEDEYPNDEDYISSRISNRMRHLINSLKSVDLVTDGILLNLIQAERDGNVTIKNYDNEITKIIKNVMDLGCGDNKFARGLKKILNVEKVYLADIAEIDSPDYIRVSNNHIDLPDNSIDLITCLVCIHHFTDILQMFSEIRRVLKPGGLLFIREHDGSKKTNCYVDIIHLLDFIRRDVRITKELQLDLKINYLSESELTEILKQFKFNRIYNEKHSEEISNPQGIYHNLYRLSHSESLPNLEDQQIRLNFYLDKHFDRVNISSDRLIQWLKQPNNINRYKSFCKSCSKKLDIEYRDIQGILKNSSSDRVFFRLIASHKKNKHN